MDSTYAPQSPDLSSFLSSASGPSPVKPQHQQQHPQASAPSSSYAPRSPNLQPFAQLESPISYAVTGQPRNLGALGPSYQPPRDQDFGGYSDPLQGQGQLYASIPSLPPSHDFTNAQIYPAPGVYPPQNYPLAQSAFKSEPLDGGFDAYPSAIPSNQSYALEFQNADMSARGKRGNGAVKSENGLEEKKGLGPSMGIDVKTKFPVARIKRIMQADEEVGKVAQVTPVAVSKALELFMISLVTRSADLARAGNSKRVTAQHLKRAIEGDEQFDFLNDIISKVVEGPEAGGKRVKDDDDSSEAESKPKKARGRKKKTEA